MLLALKDLPDSPRLFQRDHFWGSSGHRLSKRFRSLPPSWWSQSGMGTTETKWNNTDVRGDARIWIHQNSTLKKDPLLQELLSRIEAVVHGNY